MANSLRAKLSKLRHDGHITEEEYQAFIKKLNGHDKQIRAEAFDELLMKFEKRTQFLQLTRSECLELLRDLAYELKEQKE